MSVQQNMIRQLWRAQQGDEQARGEVAVYCFETYKDKLRHFFSKDPAISREDLESTFFLAIYDAVMKADERGNPLYFIGQCGMWKVQSEVRTMRRRMANISHFTHIADGTTDDPTAIDPPDPDPDFREIVASRLDDERIVHIIANANLRDRQREAMDLILAGAAGDPSEIGFNQRLAAVMGICPQRASQIMAQLEAKMWRATSGYTS